MTKTGNGNYWWSSGIRTSQNGLIQLQEEGVKNFFLKNKTPPPKNFSRRKGDFLGGGGGGGGGSD